MSFYLDTSLLVAAFTRERRSTEVWAWLRKLRSADSTISDWVETEFSSALSIKLRTGQLEIEERAEALALFVRICLESFTVIPIYRSHFRAAAKIADDYMLGLRGADALHLAISADAGATLCTLDRRLSDAGAALGIPTLLL